MRDNRNKINTLISFFLNFLFTRKYRPAKVLALSLGSISAGHKMACFATAKGLQLQAKIQFIEISRSILFTRKYRPAKVLALSLGSISAGHKIACFATAKGLQLQAKIQFIEFSRSIL